MCWNSTVSLNTFMIGLFAVLFAYYNDVVTLYEGLFYLSFFSMQLVEYFAWKNLNNKKRIIIISYIAIILLFVQVPLLALAFNKNKTYNYLIILIFSLFILLIPFKNNPPITRSQNSHLAWNFVDINVTIIYLFITFTLLLYNKEYILFIILFITLLFSLYSYYHSSTWGSVWCWTVNILSLYLIVKVFYKDFCTLEGSLF